MENYCVKGGFKNSRNESKILAVKEKSPLRAVRKTKTQK